MSATRTEAHTLTTREVMKIFEAAGIPRAQRSIERYCQQGDLDCLPDAIERRQYITRASVDTLIGQLKELAARHQKASAEQMSPTAGDDTERQDATTTTRESMKHSTPEKQGEKHAIGEYEERMKEMEARIKELENEKLTLEIDKRVREQMVGMLRDQMTQQTQTFSKELTQQSRRVGQLETEMRQLMAPSRDRRPTRGTPDLDDAATIEAEFSDGPASEHDTPSHVSVNQSPQP
jgi:ATP-dependent Lon protease